ncbi:MAG: hypothetical protein OEY93_09965 [Anaerolineae bacterium]|nr:hypothetical protein [Anaerolineae bacterium]
MNIRNFILMGLLIFLAGCATAELEEVRPTKETTNAQVETAAGTIQVIGGNEETLREFIKRFVGPSYYAGQGEDHLVLIGSLPKDLPFPLPLPEDIRIVGSFDQGFSNGIQIILDVNLPSQEVIEFYVNELSGEAWRPVEQPESGGFVSGQFTGKQYCYLEDEGFLMVNAIELEPGKTDLRLYIQGPESIYSICNQTDFGGRYSSGEALIPALVAPGGVVQESGGGGGGSGGEQYISANLVTNLSAGELIALYNQQLIDAGWELIGEDSLEGIASSQWLVIDEDGKEWSGVLLVIEHISTADKRLALLQIIRQH